MSVNHKTNSQSHSHSDSKSNSKRNGSKQEDNSLDSEVLKNNIQEFYANSKAKLIVLKNDVDSIEKDNKKEKAENNQLLLDANQLRGINESLRMKVKGMKEKVFEINKSRTEMKYKIRDFTDEMRMKGRIVNRMKIDNTFKVQMVQNEIDHIQVVKENSLNGIRHKIESEKHLQSELQEKISDIKNEIEQYKALLSGFLEEDSIRSRRIQKETAEMTKFLSEL